MILPVLPPKTASPRPSATGPSPPIKSRFADYLLTEGIRNGGFDIAEGLRAAEEEPPRSSGSTEFLSKFSPRMKGAIADLALTDFSTDPHVILVAASILAVLNPREDELEILSAVFEDHDPVSTREIMERLFAQDWITLSGMMAYMSIENRLFPALQKDAHVPPASDEAPVTQRSVPPSIPPSHRVEISVSEGYTDAEGHTGYEIVTKTV